MSIISGEPQSDAGKPQDKATKFGQVFTPVKIADEMVKKLHLLVDNWSGVTVLDPCIGKAALPKALIKSGVSGFDLCCFEIDSELVDYSTKWSLNTSGCNISIKEEDFLENFEMNAGLWDVAIANPPYIRQERIDNKNKIREKIKEKYNISVPGTSNLYVYFVIKIIMELKPGGAFSVIVYDSWMHTKYGEWLVGFINDNCDLVESTLIKNTPFEGALIDATIISGRKVLSGNKAKNKLEIGSRNIFDKFPGFVPLDKEYSARRGLRLKQASFFIGDNTNIVNDDATRFVKKPSKLSGLKVQKNHSESALLIHKNEQNKSKVMSELMRRLKLAQANPEENQSVMNWFKKRPSSWELHSIAPKAPILFNYYFRSRPKHIYNPSMISYADNYYGVIPLNGLPEEAAFALLNSTVVIAELQECSRRQGNGLQKLQLFEYRNAYIPSARNFSPEKVLLLCELGKKLSDGEKLDYLIIGDIDKVVYEATGRNPDLEPEFLLKKAREFWS